MAQLWQAILVINYVLAALFVARLLRGRKEPTAMVAWLLAIVLLPVIGMLAYWLLSSSRLQRKVKRRRRRVAHLLAALQRKAAHASPAQAPPESRMPDDLAAIVRVGRRLADIPAVDGNEVTVLQKADTTYDALETAIRNAQHHVHLEYYIWRPDATGTQFRDLLVERARAGVECRLLLDAVGCWKLSRAFLRPLVAAGVRVAFFLPVRPFNLRRRWSLHLRNHRKVVVVDGHTAFVGSQNIGDEYRGRRRELSPWYDVHLRIKGPATLFLQQTFAEDWSQATRERLDESAYFRPPPRDGDATVQILPTGPDEQVSTLTQILFAAVTSARDSIRIATPYFVPDPTLRLALAHASYRGVRVQLVLPTRSDVPLALWAARSFYTELVDAGVAVYEYERGVLHSKIVTVDDRWCLVGSANMDVRSFRLNFEVSALLYESAVAADLGAYVESFCSQARQITLRDAHRTPLWRRLGEGAARLLAPLL